MTKDFKIAICGGGIGGLALAVTIGKHSDVPIDLYEAGSEITTVGAGIGIGKRTFEIVESLGLGEAVMAKAPVPPAGVKVGSGMEMQFRRSDQDEPGYEFHTQKLPSGSVTLHRADLVGIFQNALPKSCAIHLSKRMTHYTEDAETGKITMHFADGSSATTDVLIGGDGVKSATRNSLFEKLAGEKESEAEKEAFKKHKEPMWSGTIAYRYLIPTDKLLEACPGHSATKAAIMMYCGKDKHIISYKVSQGRLLNIIAFYTVADGEGTVYPDKWFADVPTQEVVDCFKGWEPEVQVLLKCMEKPAKWAIHVVDSLPLYVNKRVALLGDAAHAMTTHFASGAGQAIEDAYIIGRVLSHPSLNLSNVAQALRVYEEARLPFANNIVQQARLTGLMYEFAAPGHYDGTRGADEQTQLKKIGEEIEKQWGWQVVVNGGPNEDWKRAEVSLKSLADTTA